MTEKILIGLVFLALGLFFISATQPVWRGEEMINEIKSNCDKVDGILLERNGLFTTSYKCVYKGNEL